MNSVQNKLVKVLVAPLDWGLGHATRCMPIIRALLAADVEVHIAGSGRSLSLLENEFPGLPFHKLPNYDVQYDQSSMEWAMIKQAPKILNAIKMEGVEMAQLQATESFDLIISDNRYGVRADGAFNVFVGHQLNIQVQGFWSLAKPFIDGQNKARINSFDELWIPDWEGSLSLSGNLSDSSAVGGIKMKYLGALPRFSPKKSGAPIYKTISVLSGPEPQRTLFEELVLQQLPEINGQHLLVRGVAESKAQTQMGNVKIVDHLTAAELQIAFENSEVAISRSGYSSIMDYCVLGQKALLVATPGQTEQEYLAKQMARRNGFASQKQDELKLAIAVKNLVEEPDPSVLSANEKLNGVLSETLSGLQNLAGAKI